MSEALVRCSLVPLERDVAQQDIYVIRANLIFPSEIIPNKPTMIRINLNLDKNLAER